MKIGRQDNHLHHTLIIALEDWRELRQFILVLLPARGPPGKTYLTAFGASEWNIRIGFNHSLVLHIPMLWSHYLGVSPRHTNRSLNTSLF